MYRQQFTTFAARVSDGTPAGAEAPIRAFVATDAREALALTTTLVRGETLTADGYTVTPTSRPGVFLVTGKPTTTRTGRTEYHGPYSVDLIAETCSCAGFAGRGTCKHIEGARLATGAPRTMALAVTQAKAEGTASALTRSLLGLVEPSTGRLYVRYFRGRPLVLAFRRQIDAERERDAVRLVDGPAEVDLTQVGALTLDALMEDGRYAGVLLVTGTQQTPIWFGTEQGTTEDGAPESRVVWGKEAQARSQNGADLRQQIAKDFD